MELFDCKDPIVQMASAYIYGIQEENASRKWSTRTHPLNYKVISNNSVNQTDYLYAPDIQHPITFSEAYFTLWAHTPWGTSQVMPWTAFRQTVYGALEAPRFLREVLTRGTPLYSEWKTGQGLRLTVPQRIAAALLRSKGQIMCGKLAHIHVKDMSILVHSHYLPWATLNSVANFLFLHEENFDQDFLATEVHHEYTFFTLPPGQENKIFKPWYQLGQVGYHDIPN
jgi:hypothetical protein